MSLVIIFLTIISVYTMFEVLGRNQAVVDVRKYKKIHKVTGYVFIAVFIFVSYFCIRYIYISRTELTPRSNLHSLLSLSVPVLFGMKLLATRVYRQFYRHVNIYGILIALITFGVAGTSAGYYLLVSRMGTDISSDKMAQYQKWADARKKLPVTEEHPVSADPQQSIRRGKDLFEAKCAFCHDPYSTETKTGPGLKGILEKPELPVSRKPATPGNIRRQLRNPFSRMPSFDYFSEEEVDDLIAYLKTL